MTAHMGWLTKLFSLRLMTITHSFGSLGSCLGGLRKRTWREEWEVDSKSSKIKGLNETLFFLTGIGGGSGGGRINKGYIVVESRT